MPRPRKVVFVETAAAMGGVEFSTLYLAQHLDRERWEPLVVSPSEGELPRACRRVGVPVQVVNLPKAKATSLRLFQQGDRRLPNPLAWVWNAGVVWLAARTLGAYFKGRAHDLVVTKGMPAHFSGGLAARWVGAPCLWHLQDFISERFWGLYARAFGWMARWLPTCMVADGSPIARQLPRTVQTRISVILNGVDTSFFRPGIDGSGVRQELELPQDGLVIGHVARLTPWKGQHHLLEAFAKLAPRFPKAYLLLVGSPVFDTQRYERRLRERAFALGLGGRVVFAGYRTDLPQVLAAMDIFAYPSLEKDTSPLALLSAMASGLPVVAYDILGVREVIGDSGELIQVNRVESFSEALGTLLRDGKQRGQLADSARRRAEERLSLDAHVMAMQAAFEACLLAYR